MRSPHPTRRQALAGIAALALSRSRIAPLERGFEAWRSARRFKVASVPPGAGR